MRSIRVSGLTALASAVAVALTAIPFSGFASGPVVEAPQTSSIVQASTATSAGTLMLETTSTVGTVSWAGQTQTFTGGQQCGIVPTPGSPNLLDLKGRTGTGDGTAGFRDGNIGVYEFDMEGDGPTNAAQCSKVDAGSFTEKETLELSLGLDAKDSFGAVFAKSATVSLVAQSQSGEIFATLLGADGTPNETRTISWGKPRLKSGEAIKVGGAFTGTGAYTGIQLRADSGSFSLVGASFELVTNADAFFCKEGSPNTFPTTGDDLSVTFIGNADGSTCSGFGIQLGRDGEAVYFYKPLTVDNEAQFIFRVPWDTITVAALSPSEVKVPTALIDFEVPGADPTFLGHEMPFCPDYLFDADGQLVGLDGSSPDDRDALAELDMETDRPVDDPILETVGTQFACIGDRDVQVTKKASGSGYALDIIDLVYLIGDARMSLK
jgi:hypothetical protein